MARLYPPNIQGTLPSFYSSDSLGTSILVPFSMNRMVSLTRDVLDHRAMRLRLKMAYTDTVIGIVDGSIVNPNEEVALEASFSLPASVTSKLHVGQYYKAQIAYIDTAGIPGYYSTVGVVKYTAKPSVIISGFDSAIVNMNPQQYVGVYTNMGDPTERAYQYKFTLYNAEGTELETSDWMTHNSYGDESTTESTDTYFLKYALVGATTYKITYEVITNNNLHVVTPTYLVMEAESIDPELQADLLSELDYNNACINLKLVAKKNEIGTEDAVTGAFILSRASSLDNYTSWTVISNFKLMGDLPSGFLFRDFTIEQGSTYKYAVQQYNDNNIYSNKILSNDIVAQFEDAYLYDGEKQLRIRFNPKVSSFKTVLLESKKNTLGSQYPFIFRNGAVAYKEFPISGTISYLMDNDQFFLDKKEILGMPAAYDETTDITDENVVYERRFKLAVLDWLNDGKVKLFKSPTEGNYIVRLMNVSLTPYDSLSRMLHSFSCQASEVAECTNENLGLYNLLSIDNIVTGQMRWGTIILADLIEEYIAKNDGNTQAAYNELANLDLVNHYDCYYLKMTDMTLGTHFKFNNGLDFVVGATGQYEANFDEPFNTLKFASVDEIYRGMPGSITYGIRSTQQNKFDAINQIDIYDITLHQTFGPQDDILAPFNDLKTGVSRLYFARFSQLETQNVESYGVLHAMLQNQLNAQQSNAETYDNVISVYTIYHTIDRDEYYVFDGVDTLTQVEDYSTEILYGDTVLNVAEDDEIYVPDLSKVPSRIKIGSAVCAELGLQIREVSYNVEDKVAAQKTMSERAYENYRAHVMSYDRATAADVRNTQTDCFVFENHRFRRLNDYERNEYALRLTNSGLTIWKLRAAPYSQQEVETAYVEYQKAHDAFMAALDDALKVEEQNAV